MVWDFLYSFNEGPFKESSTLQTGIDSHELDIERMKGFTSTKQTKSM